MDFLKKFTPKRMTDADIREQVKSQLVPVIKEALNSSRRGQIIVINELKINVIQQYAQGGGATNNVKI